MSGTALERLLKEYIDETLLLVPPGGNHGDTLLQAGFLKQAKEMGLSYHQFGSFSRIDMLDIIKDPNPLHPNTKNVKSIGQTTVAAVLWAMHKIRKNFNAIYIHGGGNFNDIWNGSTGSFITATRLFDCDIIVGPQSYLFNNRNPNELFAGIKNNVHLFCRESYSYQHMQDAIGDLEHINIYKSPDTALYFDESDLIRSRYTEEYTLIAFREDKESLGPYDVNTAEHKTIVKEDISSSRNSLDDFIEAVAKAEQVYTDRLHVATLAAILNKKVTLYGNVYHKNIGVYEYSLSDFEHVDFIDPSNEPLR